MKKSKISYVFKLMLLFIINIYLSNIYVLLLSIIYLFIIDKKVLLIFLMFFSIYNLLNIYRNNFINYGVVEEVNSNYSIIQNGLYRTKVYSSELEISDVIKIENTTIQITDLNNLKKNILFEYNNDIEIIYRSRIKKYINNQFNYFDEYTSSYLKKIILNKNIYEVDLLDIGYGFGFYYLLILVRKRNKHVSIILMFLYIVLFNFDLKFYLFIFDYLLSFFKISNLDKLSIKVILIIFINKYLLFNYSILITLLLSLYFMLEIKSSKFYFCIIQSLLFNEIQLFSAYFFKYLMYIRIFLFISSIFTLIYKPLSSLYLLVISIFSKFLSVINFSIRGRVSIFSFATIFLITRISYINKDYIKVILLIFYLITGINNPIKHISFIDVGQGDATLIKGNLNTYNILIDTGSKYNYYKLKRFLYKEGIYNLDYLIITHNDSDHNENVESLIKDFNINNIIYKGTDIKLYNDEFKYLYLGKYDNDNDNSLVYLANIDGYKILFTGDISTNVENIIVNKFNIRNIDVLKVSHHGSSSATSKRFISSILPKFATISTSGKYGHPSKETIEILDSFLVNTLVTKDSGTITFYFLKIVNFIITDIGEFAII